MTELGLRTTRLTVPVVVGAAHRAFLTGEAVPTDPDHAEQLLGQAIATFVPQLAKAPVSEELRPLVARLLRGSGHLGDGAPVDHQRRQRPPATLALKDVTSVLEVKQVRPQGDYCGTMIRALRESDMRLMEIAIHEARESLSGGGVPIGAVLARGDTLLASGHNERVQRGDPIAHGEMACLRNGGRQETYDNTTLYTTLSPCEMCSGAVLLFKIPRLIVGEATTFRGDLDRLRRRGVEIVLLEDDRCVRLMRSFQQRYPRVWLEGIGEAGLR